MKKEHSAFQNLLLERVGLVIRQSIEQTDAPQSPQTIIEIGEVLGALAGIFADFGGCSREDTETALKDGLDRAISALKSAQN